MIRKFLEHSPKIDPAARVAPSADIIGQVKLDAHVSVWYNATLRGDEDAIAVGAYTNIQDNAVCHCDQGLPVQIADHVTIGHGAVLHSCTVGSGALIGMGAILLNGCVVGKNCIVGAGALVPPGMVIPDGQLVMGSPAKVRRAVTPEEIAHNLQETMDYYTRACRQMDAPAE